MKQHNSVDRERFPAFTNELRQAMFEEPIRFVEDVIRNDRSVLDLLYGKHTFVNPVLAKHYGMPGVTGTEGRLGRASTMRAAYERGGLLPMAVFLTQNSPGPANQSREARLLGGAPAAGRGDSAAAAAGAGAAEGRGEDGCPLRDVLAQHRKNPLCAGCHARFDSFGLAMEGYGPVGEARTKDLAGRSIDASAAFPGGFQGSGIKGVQAYIKAQRQQDFLDNLSRKLLSYAFSRSLQLSDEPVVERDDGAAWRATGYRFGALVETIVTSPQFLNQRRPEPMQLVAAH